MHTRLISAAEVETDPVFGKARSLDLDAYA
jgi:hypothetical protein